MQNSQATISISTSELDELVGKFAILRARYEEKSKAAKDANAELDKCEMELMDKLKSAGKSRYLVDNIGAVTCVSRLSFRVPKDPEAKKTLFQHVEEKYGPEVLMGLLTINSMSLNSFFKEVAETPPGLEEPVANEYIQFRRD